MQYTFLRNTFVIKSAVIYAFPGVDVPLLHPVFVNQAMKYTVDPSGKWLAAMSAPNEVVLCWALEASKNIFTRDVCNFMLIYTEILFIFYGIH